MIKPFTVQESLQRFEGDPRFELLLARSLLVEEGYIIHETGYEMTDEQLATLNKALTCCSPKDKTYRPYCMRCDLMPRVVLRPDGFECWHCHNTFGFDLLPQ
jgi:hypothetical protein